MNALSACITHSGYKLRLGVVWLLLMGLGGMPAGVGQQLDSSYWDQHQIDILGKNDTLLPNHLPLLDTALAGYRFFFVGEVHWRKLNTQIQWAFLQYLHERAGVRNLIVEGGFAFGYMLNQYLETGEIRLLRKALNDIPSCPEDEEIFFKTLYDFNQSLPDSSRIKVIGIDVDKSPTLTIQVLNSLLPEDPPPLEIFPLMKRIEDLHYNRYYDPIEVRRFLKKLNRAITNKPELYEAYWGENFYIMRLLVQNTLAGNRFTFLRTTLFEKAWQKREIRMYKNFLTLQPYMAKGGYFGQFGALHTDITKSERWKFPTLANRLNHFDDSPVANKVLTISRFAGKVTRYERMKGGPQLQAWMETIKKRHPGKVVLCSLVGKGSPFKELGENFQFILWIDEELDRAACD